MKKLRYIFLIGCLATAIISKAQNATHPMTFDEMVNWNSISDQSISDDGQWVACKSQPTKGDATIRVYDKSGRLTSSFHPASNGRFSPSSRYILITRTVPIDTIERLKLKKTKEDKMPMNRLTIYPLDNSKATTIDSLKDYKLSPTDDLLAYRMGSKKDSTLFIRVLGNAVCDSFPKVTDYGFPRKGNLLYIVSDSILYTFSSEKGKTIIQNEKGIYNQPAFNEDGTKLAFLFCSEKDSANVNSSVWLSENNGTAHCISQRYNGAFPSAIISTNGSLFFSKKSSRLFFGTAPYPQLPDTTVLADNRPSVQVWSWNEETQYTVQDKNLANDKKRSYRAVYNLDNGKIFQLQTKDLTGLQMAANEDSPYVLLSSYKKYGTQSMWLGRQFYDIYLFNLDNGQMKQVADSCITEWHISPQGKFAYWYMDSDSSWYTYSFENGKQYRLTTSQSFQAWDDENDVPDYSSSYGTEGWAKDDEWILLREKYDIWKFSPTATVEPVNLTIDGKEKNITYTIQRTDPEQRFIDLDAKQLLSGFNHTTKGYGYYKTDFTTKKAPNKLLEGNFMLMNLEKAKNTDDVIFRQSTYDQYPEVRRSDMNFKNPIVLTKGGKQQSKIRWGTATLINWTSYDGRALQGVVYKPDGFNPKQKYPMIVNFYERNSDALYKYHEPSPGRSTIDYAFYLSHGFIIFNPDVRYTNTGHPGQDCYNCVLSGIDAVVKMGFVDEKHIGAQGHSWGGYQVAYLATHTTRFAAIESGAPVVNMLSAYGGIRWDSGFNRSMQYEHQQSRIGGTPWEVPNLYLENSPLLLINKIQTPILIMANDHDGYVPWYQGIEFFIAMKRLGKPAWLLNYMGASHWPERVADRVDFQKRMYQFFAHYLQNEPAPQWMEKGLPAVDRDVNLGY